MLAAVANSLHRGLLLALSLLSLTTRVRADDLADEADLHFENGAAAYQRGDYRVALERFLSSNRLVPNRNVVYNIARCYEQLGRFAEAFRYFDQARLDETDPLVLRGIESELARIGKKVSVLSVATDPPGATIYIERRDLGPRGVTPRRLAVNPGQYRVIAELPGYHPVEVKSGPLALGESRDLRIALEPIRGKVRVLADSGTKVHADAPDSPVFCLAPCELELPLGSHALYFTRNAHQPLQLSVDVGATKAIEVAPRLELQTGAIVISTDEPNALVEIDERPRGFTPAIVTLPVGKHQLRVTLEGYRTVTRSIEIYPDQQAKLPIELVQAEVVEGASRRVESVEDTPSSVSIVPQAELTALAYPTIAEALRGQPGVFLWDDRGYIGLGMRGLGRLNGYGTRVLILVDGVPMNDNWLGSSYVGYDAMTDLADVERIELVRGPGSAVYGTSAFSGVVNVITRREANTGAEVGASTNLDGVARARVRANLQLGNNSGLNASASIGRSAGRDFYLPDVANGGPRANTPDAQSGWSRGLDGMRSGTLRGRAHHGIWSVQWFWHKHDKQLPNAPFDTTFGDPNTRQIDERAFIELRAEPKLSKHTSTVTSVILNRYKFRGQYARPISVGLGQDTADGLELDTFSGSWVTVGERVVQDFGPLLALTVGGEATWHLQVRQTGRDAGGQFLDASNPYRVVAGFAILDAKLGSRAHISFGGRVDNYTTFGTSINPRVGIVVKPYTNGNTKLTVGRAFRAPSSYELYYNDAGRTQFPSSALKPEVMLSAEAEHAHRFTPTVVGTVAVYANSLRGLIDTVDDTQDPQKFRFANTQTPIAAVGTEVGLRRDWRSGWMASIYYGYTQTRFLKDASWSSLLALDRGNAPKNVANSPVHAATFKGVAPFLMRGLNLGTRITLEDGRWDRYEATPGVRQTKTQAAVLWDLVLSAEDTRHHLRGALGIYNLFDWRYQYPVGSESTLQRTLPSLGRTLLVSLESRF